MCGIDNAHPLVFRPSHAGAGVCLIVIEARQVQVPVEKVQRQFPTKVATMLLGISERHFGANADLTSDSECVVAGKCDDVSGCGIAEKSQMQPAHRGGVEEGDRKLTRRGRKNLRRIQNAIKSPEFPHRGAEAGLGVVN